MASETPSCRGGGLSSETKDDLHEVEICAYCNAKSASLAAKKRHLVLIIHGMNDVAPWAESVRAGFESHGIEAIPIGYEFATPVDFVLPFGALIRQPEIYDEILSNVRGDRLVSIVAHSFGTWFVGKILAKHHEIKIHRLVLCGAVLPRSFHWRSFFGRNIAVDAVVNDCGLNDNWPFWASFIFWRYGSSGSFGFRKSGVKDRFHDCNHSGFLNQDFAENYWVPWIAGGVYVPSPFHKHRPSIHRWKQIGLNFTHVLMWLAIIALFYWCFRPTVDAVMGAIEVPLPATALDRRLDPELVPWHVLVEDIKPGSDEQKKTAVRLNKWRSYLAKGAQPWLGTDPAPHTTMAWFDMLPNVRSTSACRYSCGINSKYKILEIYAFLYRNADPNGFSPVLRQLTPTIGETVCEIPIEARDADERLLVFMLVTTTDNTAASNDPSSWGFYLLKR